METKAREAAEQDFVEVSAVGKTRLLYLEQWKVGATARLLRLQQRLEKSVPEEVSTSVSNLYIYNIGITRIYDPPIIRTSIRRRL